MIEEQFGNGNGIIIRSGYNQRWAKELNKQLKRLLIKKKHLNIFNNVIYKIIYFKYYV